MTLTAEQLTEKIQELATRMRKVTDIPLEARVCAADFATLAPSLEALQYAEFAELQTINGKITILKDDEVHPGTVSIGYVRNLASKPT